MRKNGTERNYGVDLLRVLSVIGIIALHIMTVGGVFNNVNSVSSNSVICYFVMSIGFCGVDCFALISGFVYSRSFKLNRLINLWLEVIFYSLGITIAFKIFAPRLVTTIDWVNALLPVSRRFYWYFSAYFGMFFLMPLLSFLVDSLPKKTFERTLLVAFFLFCILERFGHMNAFSLCSGHSTLWLSVLYLCGGYLKKYFGQRIEDGLIRKKAIVCYVMMIFATWLSALVISITTTIVLGKSAWTTILIADNSPTIVLASISLLLLFSSIKVTKTKKKILRIVSPCSFGVYLVHVHPLIWKNILKNCMINNLHLPMLLFVAKVMCHVITIYIICFIIEKIREIFFSRCKVYLVSNTISQFVMNQATNIFNITLNSRQ